MTASAAAKTFGVPELLEMILVRLPMKGLLFIQRVSKDFRASVTSSKRLQERLFFQLEKVCGADIPYISDLVYGKGVNALLSATHANNKWLVQQLKVTQERMHPLRTNELFCKRAILHGQSRQVSRSTESLPIKSLNFLHPAVTRLALLKGFVTGDEVTLCVDMDASVAHSDAAPAADSEASWRQMLVKQCPCKKLAVELEVNIGRKTPSRVYNTVLPAVTRMGEIMDWCESKYAESVNFAARGLPKLTVEGDATRGR